MKKKLRMYYYRFTAKLIEFRDFINGLNKKLNDSPFAFIYSITGILIIFLIIYGIVSLSGNSPTNDNVTLKAEASSVFEAMVATDITETSVLKETSSILETTEKKTEEKATASQLINISDIQISDRDLSEPLNKNNAVSNSDAPVYTDTAVSTDFSPVNSSSVIYGIDVSKWQGNIDWSKVAAAGYRFVFIKVGGRGTGTGSLYYDDAYKKNIQGAINAGLDVGVYFFSQAITEHEALEEASLIINAIKDCHITYPVVFDWETGYHSNGSPYRSNGAGLSKSSMTRIVNAFLNAVESAGYEAMVYGNAYDLSLFDINSVSKSHRVWYARYWSYYRNYNNYYIPGKETPVTSFPYQIWQYKDTGIVPGISEKVDMNVLFISNTINISVKNNLVNIVKGDNYNPLSGITAKNSMSKDVSDCITYTVTDSSQKTVSLNYAINNAGTYTVTYSAQYLGEASNTPSVKLVVSNPPVISLKTDGLIIFDYCSNPITTNEIACTISTLVYDNVIKHTDYAANDSSSVSISLPSPMFISDSSGNIISDLNDTGLINDTIGLTLTPGKYDITYILKLEDRVLSSKVFTLNIITVLNDCLTFYTNDITADFRYTLYNSLSDNLSLKTESIDLIFDEALESKLIALENGTNEFSDTDTFTVTYTLQNSILGTMTRNCTISFISSDEEATASTEESLN